MVFVLFILQEIGIVEIECKAHQLHWKIIVAIFLQNLNEVVSEVKFWCEGREGEGVAVPVSISVSIFH